MPAQSHLTQSKVTHISDSLDFPAAPQAGLRFAPISHREKSKHVSAVKSAVVTARKATGLQTSSQMPQQTPYNHRLVQESVCLE